MTSCISKKHLICLLLLIPLLAACGSSGSVTGGSDTSEYSAEMVETGKALYLQTCFACHGPDAKGLPNLGKDLTTSEFFSESSDAELIAYVVRGRPANDPLNTTGVAMPPKGGFAFLTEDDIQAILAYLRVGLVGE